MITKLVATLATALFGVIVNSSAAGAVLKEDVPDLGSRNIHSPVPQQTRDDPLKWEVPDLGSRNIH